MNPYSFLKTKAIFQIILVISLAFFMSVRSPSVTAEEAVAPGCCKQTTSGEFCVDVTNQDQCAPDQYSTSSCSLTSGCGQTGCCITANNQCSAATTKTSCDLNNGVFHEGISCTALDICKPTCCVVGNNCNLQTAYSCTNLGGEQNPELTA